MPEASNSMSVRAAAWGWAAAQIILLVTVLASGPLFHGDWDAELSRIVGRVLLILGAAFALPGFLALGRNLRPHPEPRANATFVRHGIYALVRHPLYLSLILSAVGWALIWQSTAALAGAVALAVLLNRKARIEERFLRERFPEYADYSRRVRRFVPWIY